MKAEFLIAWRQMTHRKGNGFISLISFISVAGIAVGVMALIIVLSVMSGFERDLKAKIVGANPHILITGTEGIENADELIPRIKDAAGSDLLSAAPYVEGQGILRSDTNATGVIVKGLSTDDDSIVTIKDYLLKGEISSIFEVFEFPSSLEGADDELVVGSIAIGHQLAAMLRVDVGDEVRVISPHMEQKKSFLPKRPKTEIYRVGAVFELGMSSLDSTLVMLDLEHAARLFNLEGKCSGIAVKLRDVLKADVLKKEIQKELGYPYWARSWIDMNRNFFSALKVEKHVMAILLFLIILVAGFNIVSTLIMVVMEKTKDIGIIKSLGATRGAVMRIFLIQGSSVGLIGLITGTVLGLLITFNLNAVADFIEKTTGFEVFPSDIYFFSEIPVEINTHDIIWVVSAAFVVTILAGLYPAFCAARLKTVDALRYE